VILLISAIASGCAHTPVNVRTVKTDSVQSTFRSSREGRTVIARYYQAHGAEAAQLLVGDFTNRNIHETQYATYYEETLSVKTFYGIAALEGLILGVMSLGMVAAVLQMVPSDDWHKRNSMYGGEWSNIGYVKRVLYSVSPFHQAFVNHKAFAHDRITREKKPGVKIDEREYSRRLPQEGSNLAVRIDGRSSEMLTTDKNGMARVKVRSNGGALRVQLDVAGCRRALREGLILSKNGAATIIDCH
jgi:hypothetical protein